MSINHILPTLYSFKRCPYAIRARMALAFAKINYIHREIDLRNKHPRFLETSPKGTVPVFENEGLILDESIDIVIHALNHHLPDGWETNSILESQLSCDLIQELTKDAVPAIRQIKYTQPNEVLSESPTSSVNQYLSKLDNILGTGNFLHSKPSALDLIIFPNIRQLVIHDPTWFKTYQFHHVANWLQRWSSHPVFMKIFVSQPIWNDEQAPIIIDNQHNYAIH